MKDPEYTINFHRNALLDENEMAGASHAELARFASLRREPLVLDAVADKVLQALDAVAELQGQPA